MGNEKGAPSLGANRSSQGWSCDDAEKLHLSLLEKSLRQLKSKVTSAATRKDILLWVKVGELGEPRALSFHACCLFAGLEPGIMREQVQRIVRNQGEQRHGI